MSNAVSNAIVVLEECKRLSYGGQMNARIGEAIDKLKRETDEKDQTVELSELIARRIHYKISLGENSRVDPVPIETLQAWFRRAKELEHTIKGRHS